MRLVVVPELMRRACPIDSLAAADALGRLVDPRATDDPFRSNADAALEEPVKRTDRYAREPREVLGARDPAIRLRLRDMRSSIEPLSASNFVRMIASDVT